LNLAGAPLPRLSLSLSYSALIKRNRLAAQSSDLPAGLRCESASCRKIKNKMVAEILAATREYQG
jgi:hypothetical protein